MSGQEETEIVIAPRGWSIFGFLFLAPVAVVALGSSIFMYVQGGRIGPSLLMAALGLAVFFPAADFLLRAIRPSRLVLAPQGLTLDTFYGVRTWPWPAVCGLQGWFNLLLRVADENGRVRRLTIGHWPLDMPRRLYIHAGLTPVPEPHPPSSANFFFTAGLILLLTLLFAWASLPA